MALVKILLSHPLRLPMVGTSPYHKGRGIFSSFLILDPINLFMRLCLFVYKEDYHVQD